MKNYLAIESARPIHGRYSFNIYRIKKNKLSYIGEWDFCYACTRGQRSEVLNKLIELKEIPKKYYWYYSDLPNEKYNIIYICPLDQK